LHNVKGNPELLAILKVATDVSEWPMFRKSGNIVIVTDTELGSHSAMNSRAVSLCGPYLLPTGFTLMYASRDTGAEATNKVFRMCDQLATGYLRQLEAKTLPQSPLLVLREDVTVKYRYINHSGVEIVNPLIRGFALGPDAILNIYGVRD
jgi:hypothetical protein